MRQGKPTNDPNQVKTGGTLVNKAEQEIAKNGSEHGSDVIVVVD